MSDIIPVGMIEMPDIHQSATLYSDGQWSVSDPLLQQWFNTMYEITNPSPADGNFGWAALDKVAKAMNGNTTIFNHEDDDDETALDDKVVIY